MSRRDRARSFLFEPARFKNDEAVLTMSLEARGAYAILFCELWDQPEPGVVRDDDRLLASLARATTDEWVRIGSDVRRAFDAQERPGYLVQRGLVATVKAQDRFIASQSHAGHVAAKARWANEKMRRASEPHPTPNATDVTPSVLGSRFSVLGETESKPERPRARKPRAPRRQLSLEELAAEFGIPVALVKANLAKIRASGKYRNEYQALVNWCKNDAADGTNGNGRVQSLEEVRCSVCHYGPLEQPQSIADRLCGSCRGDQAIGNELSR